MARTKSATRQSAWASYVNSAAKKFALGTAKRGQLPRLARAIDADATQILSGVSLREAKESFNPLYVENLLESCVERVEACLTMRDRARELETKALFEALEIDFQGKLIDANLRYDAAVLKRAPGMAQHAVGFSVAEGEIKATPVPDEYWEEISRARLSQSEIMKEYYSLRLERGKEEGGSANYTHRYEQIYKLFSVSLQDVYARCLVCREALYILYDIDEELPDPRNLNFLDDLALWVQSVSNLLDRKVDQRVIGELVLAVSANGGDAAGPFHLLSAATFNGQRTAARFSFTIAPTPFAELGMDDPKLRTLRLQARSTPPAGVTRVWPGKIQLPIVTGLHVRPPIVAALAADDFRELDTGQTVVRGVHNIDPRGPWEITLHPKSTDGASTTALRNIYLYLRVSYRPL